MERVSQKMSGLQINLGPVKEPLGFIKVLEWIFAIFAFATCGGYSGKTSLNLTCGNGSSDSLQATFAYPFRLHQSAFNSPLTKECKSVWNTTYYLVGDFSSPAQFFVTFAVFVFLYCMAALVLYVGYLHLYRGTGKLPMIDFAITVVVSFLWLVSTSAWAKALTDIKWSTGNGLTEFKPCANNNSLCHLNDIRSLGSLNVSVVIGFLNLILWGGNAWFVYKETHLHNPPAAAPPTPGNLPPHSGM